jgi:hypothetical protein
MLQVACGPIDHPRNRRQAAPSTHHAQMNLDFDIAVGQKHGVDRENYNAVYTIYTRVVHSLQDMLQDGNFSLTTLVSSDATFAGFNHGNIMIDCPEGTTPSFRTYSCGRFMTNELNKQVNTLKQYI